MSENLAAAIVAAISSVVGIVMLVVTIWCLHYWHRND
jgi:hypothetical protein